MKRMYPQIRDFFSEIRSIKKPLFNSAKPFSRALLIVSCCFSAQLLANDDTADFTVLQNSETDTCLYSGDVVLDVSYALYSYDAAQVQVQISLDGYSYADVSILDIEAGIGNSIVEFYAGECAQAIRVSIL